MVFAQTTEKTVTIHKGWNILPLGARMLPISHTCDYFYGVDWLYTPRLGKYVFADLNSELVNQDDKASIQQDMLDDYLYVSAGSGYWHYSNEDCTVTYNTQPEADLEPKILKGWNFITIQPWMTSNTLRSFIGNCQLEKMNYWDNGIQNWRFNPSLVPDDQNHLLDSLIFESDVGNVALMKFSENCELSISSITGPPQIPE